MNNNQNQLIDIYDIWYEPFYKQTWFMTLTIILLALLLSIFMYCVYKKYRKQVSVVDCAVTAFQGIELLKKIHIVTKQDSKDCYFSLSSIIKQYLACRYDGIFTRLTDKEIMVHAERYMHAENVLLLEKILHAMVLVKFEHKIAATEKLEKDIILVEEFIRNTTPQLGTKEK